MVNTIIESETFPLSTYWAIGKEISLNAIDIFDEIFDPDSSEYRLFSNVAHFDRYYLAPIVQTP